jgi:hypothetical protein
MDCRSSQVSNKLKPHMIDEIGALRGAGLAALRALRREYSRRLRDADARSVLRLANELKSSGVVHRFFSDELIANHKGAMESLTRRGLEQIGAGMNSWDQVKYREQLHSRVVREVENKLRTGLKNPPPQKSRDYNSESTRSRKMLSREPKARA